jgi:Protein of unknown function (DUF1236)
MTHRFMISVAAAALIAGTGFANAQGTMGREAPSTTAPAAQGAPPSEHSATPGRQGAEPMAPSSGMKATQSDQKPGGMKTQRAEDNVPGQKPGTKSEMNGTKGGAEMKAEGREGNRDGMKPERAEEGRSQNTTGQAGAGAKLSGDQRTRISGAIRGQHVAPLAHVNFSISVGTRVPRDVSFRPLPAEVLTIYPEWRGYEFILVNDQIVVIDPRTFEIVAVLDA